jgi:phospholipase D1/2
MHGTLRVCIVQIENILFGRVGSIFNILQNGVHLEFQHGNRFLGRVYIDLAQKTIETTFVAPVNGNDACAIRTARGRKHFAGAYKNLEIDETKTNEHKKVVLWTGVHRVCVTYNARVIPAYDTSDQVCIPYFPLRQNNNVELFADAAGNPNLWQDISNSIMAAKRFIYIAGHSIDIKQRLVRDNLETPALGVQLMTKAQQGVNILIILWNSPALFLENGDNEMQRFFYGTPGVHTILARRKRGKAFFQRTSFTHHQKAIVMDCDPDSNGSCGLVAYLGGLDLTRGRYDNEDHSIFQSLHTVHGGDFMQSTIPGADAFSGAPRLPWHDVHAKICGPAAEDVLVNFQERWTQEAKYHRRAKKDMIEMLVSSNTQFVFPEQPPGNRWDVRVLRSIDSSSAYFSRSTSALHQSRRGFTQESTLHQAMICAIRGAQKFVYIEQQYFVSGWQDGNISAHNIIALELSSRICEHIKNGTPFHVYILLPLHPDGDPSSLVVQTILAMQRETISVITRQVAAMLKRSPQDSSSNTSNVSQDQITKYISVFALAKLEPRTMRTYEFIASPGTVESATQISRRFMIYVHSKMMIVDDKIIIIGSANVNDRSMHGSRDTEIAILASQLSKKGNTLTKKGAVRNFRLRLWEEHTGYDFSKCKPETDTCALQLQQIADDNWTRFRKVDFYSPWDSTGHLVRYPYNLVPHGVTGINGTTHFPDRPRSAKVLGTFPRKMLFTYMVA